MAQRSGPQARQQPASQAKADPTPDGAPGGTQAPEADKPDPDAADPAAEGDGTPDATTSSTDSSERSTSADPTPDGAPADGDTVTRELLAPRYTDEKGKRHKKGDKITLNAERADQLVTLGVLKPSRKPGTAPKPGGETRPPE